ncbi:Hypothetical Protein FCC1311_061902 [Hondaea fermentalgiana]|uniref:Uncharacterized protein n=1 Tax=Hondaea fermentalgiana TaxID=2315210 RepID=A0A2R5GGG9_9STRA|nr:Hypothetical Protein FCC1311_061902 [Hondaea fermentalgiana]|eukprot:GBG29970.1 Hypothetical Protein FCC1311_061902 [Hondaea fermentalgiana]
MRSIRVYLWNPAPTHRVTFEGLLDTVVIVVSLPLIVRSDNDSGVEKHRQCRLLHLGMFIIIKSVQHFLISACNHSNAYAYFALGFDGPSIKRKRHVGAHQDDLKMMNAAMAVQPAGELDEDLCCPFVGFNEISTDNMNAKRFLSFTTTLSVKVQDRPRYAKCRRQVGRQKSKREERVVEMNFNFNFIVGGNQLPLGFARDGGASARFSRRVSSHNAGPRRFRRAGLGPEALRLILAADYDLEDMSDLIVNQLHDTYMEAEAEPRPPFPKTELPQLTNSANSASDDSTTSNLLDLASSDGLGESDEELFHGSGDDDFYFEAGAHPDALYAHSTGSEDDILLEELLRHLAGTETRSSLEVRQGHPSFQRGSPVMLLPNGQHVDAVDETTLRAALDEIGVEHDEFDDVDDLRMMVSIILHESSE